MTKIYPIICLISFACFSQSKTYTIDKQNSITRIYKNKNLKFVVKSNGTKTEYDFGFFEADTTLLNEKPFIIQKGSEIELSDILNIDNTLLTIQVADWKDNYYLFQFSDKGNGVKPDYLTNGKITANNYRRSPYEYYNVDKRTGLTYHHTIEEDKETGKPMIEVVMQDYFGFKTDIYQSDPNIFNTLQEYIFTKTIPPKATALNFILMLIKHWQNDFLVLNNKKSSHFRESFFYYSNTVSSICRLCRNAIVFSIS